MTANDKAEVELNAVLRMVRHCKQRKDFDNARALIVTALDLKIMTRAEYVTWSDIIRKEEETSLCQ